MQPGWGGGCFGKKKKMTFILLFVLGELFGKMGEDGRSFEELNDHEKKCASNWATLINAKVWEYEGALTWWHEGVHRQDSGTLKNAANSVLWKDDGWPPAGIWVLHADRQGYDFWGTLQAFSTGSCPGDVGFRIDLPSENEH